MCFTASRDNEKTDSTEAQPRTTRERREQREVDQHNEEEKKDLSGGFQDALDRHSAAAAAAAPATVPDGNGPVVGPECCWCARGTTVASSMFGHHCLDGCR